MLSSHSAPFHSDSGPWMGSGFRGRLRATGKVLKECALGWTDKVPPPSSLSKPFVPGGMTTGDSHCGQISWRLALRCDHLEPQSGMLLTHPVL